MMLTLLSNLQSVKKRDRSTSEDRSRPTLAINVASCPDEHLTNVLPIYSIAHGVPPRSLAAGEEFDPTLGAVKCLDPVTDFLGLLRMPTDRCKDHLSHVDPHPGQFTPLGRQEAQLYVRTGVIPLARPGTGS